MPLFVTGKQQLQMGTAEPIGPLGVLGQRSVEAWRRAAAGRSERLSAVADEIAARTRRQQALEEETRRLSDTGFAGDLELRRLTSAATALEAEAQRLRERLASEADRRTRAEASHQRTPPPMQEPGGGGGQLSLTDGALEEISTPHSSWQIETEMETTPAPASALFSPAAPTGCPGGVVLRHPHGPRGLGATARS